MYRSKPITRANLAHSLSIDITSIEQIDSKQLFIVSFDAFDIALYSYYTRVGTFVAGVWYLTTTRYSRTTSKQLTQFARGRKVVYADMVYLINSINAPIVANY